MKIQHIMAVFLICGSTLLAWDGPTDAAAWTLISDQVESNRVELVSLMAQADAAGLNTDYATVSKVVVEQFQTFAQYDYDNPTFWSNAVADTWWSHKMPSPDSYHIELPFDEMQGCLELSSNAIVELQQQLAEQIVLKAPLDLSSGTMTLTNDYWALDGVPAIPSTFTWMPNDEDLKQAFGRISGSYYQLTNLEPDGMVTPSYLAGERDDAYDQTTNNMVPQQIFLGGSVDSWMIATNPAVTNGARNFVKYDTDSPQIRGWLTQLFEDFIPEVCGPNGSGDGTRMHLLANEPNFATRLGGWKAENGVSANTMTNYKSWLQAKYTTVSNLNAVYGTSHVDFNAAMNAMTMPIDPDASATPQGGPVWHDWCRFNMDRINDFFEFLKDGTQSNDPGSAPATIKVLGRQFLSERDEGMDVEYLAKLMDVQGADNKTVPLGMSNLNYKESMSWTNRYGMKWTGQSTTLDFMRSVSPGKAFYDSEWHGLSTGRWRDFSMDPDYVRAAIWMAVTHGTRAMQAWFWIRNADGSMLKANNESAMIGSITTLPAALDAYGRTFKELNAHAGSVVSLIPEIRHYMIYHCDESAIQDPDYLEELEYVYEALKLLNVPVGFVTPSSFSNLNSSVQTVIMPPAQFVSDDSLSKLQAFEGAGGKFVQVNGASASFAKDEHGAARSSSGLTPYANITYSSDTFTMASDLESALSALKPDLPVEVVLSGYGVLAMQSMDPATSNATVALINLSKEPRNVSLQAGDKYFRDQLTGKLSSGTFSMESMDVRLLATEDTSVKTIVQWGEPGGDTAIVTNNQDFVPYPAFTTYTHGSTASPVQGPDYYPNSTNRSPVFNHATKNAYNGKRVSDGGATGDFITTAKNDAAYTAMVVWENFLQPASTLAGLEIETRVNNSTDTPSQFRWLVRKGAGNWYASESTDTSDDYAFYSTDDPGSLSWFNFTPHVSSVASVGATASITMDHVDVVGYYATFQQTNAMAYRASETRYFKGTAFSATPPTGWELFVLNHGLSGVATNDYDMDGEPDLMEYALGGNPTNPAEQGEAPSLAVGSNQTIRFHHLQIEQDDSGITYVPQWTDNLITGGWSSVFGWSTNLPSAFSNYTEAAYEVNDGTNSSLYFRLNISQP